MDHLAYHINTNSFYEMIHPVIWALALCLFYYQLDSYFLIGRFLLNVIRKKDDFKGLAEENQIHAVVAMPTMLKNEEELEGIKQAVRSVIGNQYPGRLTIVVSIDDSNAAPPIFHKLKTWIHSQSKSSDTQILLASSYKRRGKAMAVENAIVTIERMVQLGKIPKRPEVFFNMDADSELAPQALERMVYRLTRRSRLKGERPMIVAANVSVKRKVFWSGWRNFFTTKGVLSLAVANEFMTAISTAKHNTKLLPVLVASGALYCTWYDIPRQSARFAAFMQTLRFRDLIRWWFGSKPPEFIESEHSPNPQALTGEGDDAWMTWMASAASWDGDRISLKFPRTPFHAFMRMVKFYFSRPLDYDPMAKIYTSTPTSIKALFKQRLRWNGSRVWCNIRWMPAFCYQWGIAMTVFLNTAVLVAIHALILVSFVISLVVGSNAYMIPILIMAHLVYMLLRTQALLIAFLYDRDFRGQWQKILVIPLMPFYHFVFNIIPTIISFSRDIFLFGSNTRFAPESTLVEGGTVRMALSYRAKRMLTLAVRCATHNDVPMGMYWIGWKENEWVNSGYDGWAVERSPCIIKASPAQTFEESELSFSPEPTLLHHHIPLANNKRHLKNLATKGRMAG